MTYTIASHSAYNSDGDEIFGPANNIYSFLSQHKVKTTFIKHALNGDRPSLIVSGAKQVVASGVLSSSLLVRSFRQVKSDYIHAKKGKGSVYIGVDPVNGIAGLFLKLFHKTQKFIYLTPDYTEKRFGHKFINAIYHLTDRACLKFADEVWSVSSRIMQKRRDQGLPECKNKLLVNSPDFKSIKQRDYDGNQDLLVISPLSATLNLEPILEALSLLSGKCPNLRLRIVGTGPEEENFKRMVERKNLSAKVQFLGWKQHEEVFAIISRSFLGFALYTNATSWNVYGDSMKAREYVACGLPVIINDIPSTADEIGKYAAGVVLKKIDSREIARFIQKCVINDDFYHGLRANALKMGEDFDKNKILVELLGMEKLT